MKVYLSSSWKNDGPLLDRVAARLRGERLEVNDFRSNGRWWEGHQQDPIRGWLGTRTGAGAYKRDVEMMLASEGAFVVLPAGESTAMEAAWFASRDIPIVVWGRPRGPLELMWGLIETSGGLLMFDDTLESAVATLKHLIEGPG